MIYINNLESDITDHCNLKCENCSHHSPFIKKGEYDVEEFERDIKAFSKYVNSEWYKLLGGEPLLNKKLQLYIDTIKRYNISKKIAIFTNGVLLEKVDKQVLESVDCISVSVYPTRYKADIQAIVRELQSQIKTTFLVNEVNTFEQQDFLQENTDKKLLSHIWDNCKIKLECNAIYRGYFSKCMTSFRKKEFLKKFNVHTNLDPNIFGCAIHQEDFKRRFLEYYYSNKMLDPCRWCTGSSGKDIQHSQVASNYVPSNSITEIINIDRKININDPQFCKPSIITRTLNVKSFVDIDGIHHKNDAE